jgi:hypothetical protein
VLTDANTGEVKLWIHHFVILQLFHPLFHFDLGDGSPISFSDDNHYLFVERISDRHIQLYIKIYEDTPNFSWMCLGFAGKF